MPVTIRDVARASGVHISTVSRTFSAPHLVNPETRVRVLACAEDLGYRPNRAARALITGRTHNIGLIIADIANPFFPPLIKAAESQARHRDYHVFVADTNEDAAAEEELVHALAKQVDGVLLCSPRMSNSLIEQLSREVPLVVVNRQLAGLPCVLMDVGQGARSAIEHLAGLGHREMALLGGPRGSWTSRELRRAASAAARAAGAELTVLGPNPPTETGGLAQAEQVRRAGVTAVLAYNDLMAIGLLEGLDALGVRVPQEVSVVGVDDISLSRLTRPKLTTVATPTAAAGRTAVDMLLQQDTDFPRTARGGGATVAVGVRRTTAQVMLQTELVIRDSTAPGPYAGRERPGTAAAGPGPHRRADPGNPVVAAGDVVAS
ncbi:LacI family DNA-binding transcriptional regulator [Verrucosispora sp. WMMD703]|uniref:LacI family transcriptional regulator n=1 Tax=Micromonospora sediminimaris TaxID=547162 RepID=A0A9W5UMG1_9ACTN|nr:MULTISPECIES: LacI family DNA-binding transcriptional regulator [Micromonospora]WFE43485.1 LacI family DNA-binding transcriptional regulator [Verrucosispora sp. WMMD1129]GIJ31516.1 LacI family transcriptional regulator [Micromonospora sediminimaris]SFC37806.1 transcriptional regulator, LacI family [Micromonospora sediminimaris]